MTTDATNGIEPIVVGIKRDTREILDIFAPGDTSPSRPGEYAASPGKQTDIVITVKLDGTGRDFVETSRQGSGGGRVQIASPAPVVASPASVASTAPVTASPAHHVTHHTPRAPQSRDANGRFISATQQLTGAISTLGENISSTAGASQSVGQSAHTQATSGGAVSTAGGTSARPQPSMGRGRGNAGINPDLAETVGMATLGGPLTGVISEMVGLGSQIKDTFTGIIDKFRGIRGTGDRSVDAQITATSAVTTAVQASTTAAAQQNQQLIGAIST